MMKSRTHSLLLIITIVYQLGCAVPPDFTGPAVNTPKYYRENKAFYARRLPASKQFSAKFVAFDHLHQLDSESRKGDLFDHGDPISVVLQTVRLPKDLPTGPTGTIDVAVVLDVHTSQNRGITTLLAFYQRDMPPGQELLFKNLLVYADPMWDSANPPYFRIRILDVKSERNRGMTAFLDGVANLSGEISGLVPHPAIPIVTTAIEAAGLILGNAQNTVLLDYQIQFYSKQQVAGAGGATLGPLVAGQWFVVGRPQAQDSTFWQTPLLLERSTGMIVTVNQQTNVAPVTPGVSARDRDLEHGDVKEVLVPYVSVVLVKADAEVPKLVLDRSESLLALLSSPSSKSDVDILEQLSSNLSSAINGYIGERRLSKYRSVNDLREIIDRFKGHVAQTELLNTNEARRLIYVMRSVTTETFNTIPEWITWWNSLDQAEYELVPDTSKPFGIVLRKRVVTSP